MQLSVGIVKMIIIGVAKLLYIVITLNCRGDAFLKSHRPSNYSTMAWKILKKHKVVELINENSFKLDIFVVIEL